jgi:hypothetical protein
MSEAAYEKPFQSSPYKAQKVLYIMIAKTIAFSESV